MLLGLLVVGRGRMATEVTPRFVSCLGVRYHELLPRLEGSHTSHNKKPKERKCSLGFLWLGEKDSNPH